MALVNNQAEASLIKVMLCDIVMEVHQPLRYAYLFHKHTGPGRTIGAAVRYWTVAMQLVSPRRVDLVQPTRHRPRVVRPALHTECGVTTRIFSRLDGGVSCFLAAGSMQLTRSMSPFSDM